MSTEYEIFEGWLEKFKFPIEQGEIVQVPVRDLNTHTKVTVRAKIGQEAGGLENPDRLRMVNDLGEKKGDLFISVLETLGELESVALEM